MLANNYIKWHIKWKIKSYYKACRCALHKKTIVWNVYYINDKTELLKTYKIRKMGNYIKWQRKLKIKSYYKACTCALHNLKRQLCDT